MVSLTEQLCFLPSFLPSPLSLTLQNIHNKMLSGATADSHSAVQGKYSSQKPTWYLLICPLEHFSIFVFTDDSHLFSSLSVTSYLSNPLPRLLTTQQVLPVFKSTWRSYRGWEGRGVGPLGFLIWGKEWNYRLCQVHTVLWQSEELINFSIWYSNNGIIFS